MPVFGDDMLLRIAGVGGLACAPDGAGHAMAFGWEAKHNRQVIRPNCQPHEGPQVAKQVLLIPLNAA